MKAFGRPGIAALLLGTLVLTGLPLSGLSACGSGDANAPPAQSEPDIEGVLYAGQATDEALLALLRLEPQYNAAQTALIDSPASNASLPKSPAATFAWHIGESSAALNLDIKSWGASFASLWMPRKAHAHGAPVNGRAYFLVFSTPSKPKLLRVFTTELSYTPDAAAWATLSSSSEPISLTITNAVFENNRVAQDGGPFEGQALTFSFVP